MAHIYRLSRTQTIDKPLNEVFAFFADASNLEALTPGFLKFRILTPLPIPMARGTRIEYSLSMMGVPMRWRSLISDWQPGIRFVDEQESGPYAYWHHAHEFEALGQSTIVRDIVDYALPLGPLGRLAHALFVQRLLTRIFDYRRQAIGQLTAL